MTFGSFIRKLITIASGFMPPEGVTPDFLSKRDHWVQTISREDLLEALYQLATSDCPKDHYKWYHIACLAPQEIKSIKSTFQAHCLEKGGVRYWNQDNFVSSMKTRVPISSKSSFQSCSSTLYSCIRYFAWYPFIPTDHDILTYDALVRALGFLLGREKRIFNNWASSVDFIDATRVRTEKMTHGDIFRSLVTSRDQLCTADTKSLDEDVIDILAQIQPILNYRTGPLRREQLNEPVRRLSLGKIPLERLSASKADILELLTFLIEILDGIADAEKQPSPLGRKLEALKVGVSQTEGETLSIEDIEIYYFQRAVVVCFEMLVKSPVA